MTLSILMTWTRGSELPLRALPVQRHHIGLAIEIGTLPACVRVGLGIALRTDQEPRVGVVHVDEPPAGTDPELVALSAMAEGRDDERSPVALHPTRVQVPSQIARCWPQLRSSALSVTSFPDVDQR